MSASSPMLAVALSVLWAVGLAAAEPAKVPADEASKTFQDAVAAFQTGIAADSKALDGIDTVELNPIRIKKEIEKDPEKARIVDEAQQQIQWARSQFALAQAAATRAVNAPNPAQAQVELRTAYDLQQQANNWKRRAEAALQPARPTTAPSTPAATVPIGSLPNLFRFESPTFEALKQINATEGSRPDQPALPKRGFETIGRADAQFADPVGYDSDSGVLVTREGRRINVKPLVEAARQMMPAVSSRELFVPVPTPSGTGYQLNAQAQKALAAPDAAEKLKTIGGVALDATLHLLSYDGVPGFRKLGPATVVDSPVLLSLGALYERLRPFEDKWEQLPDELRHPAGIGRVHGFVLDPAHQDLFLVCTRARQPQDRLDLDCLILALRSTWKDGAVPAVSLDPVPPHWAGPQYCRIYGVPADSLGAKIMIEADYAMKKMMDGVSGASLPGFVALLRQEAEVELALALAGQTSSRFKLSRFWLVPAPLTPGDLHLSVSYRTTLFDSRVLCRTEALSLTGNKTGAPWRGTGEKSTWSARKTDLFNASYEELETSPVPQPAGVFSRLHGLTDLVMAAKLLREFSVRYPVLERFGALGIRRLPPDEAVPPFYPGVFVEYATDKGALIVSGGAELRVRALRSALDLYNDITTTRLEQAVDRFPRATQFYLPLDFAFTLPRPQADSAQLDRIDEVFNQASAALAKGEYKEARGGFESVTREEPNHGDAWVGLAAAYNALNDRTAAVRAMTCAIQSELTACEPLCGKEELVREAGEQLEKTAEGRLALQRVGEQLTQRAVAAMIQNDKEQAKRLAQVVATAMKDRAMACMVLALCLTDDPEQAADYREKALFQFRVRAVEEPASHREFASALILDAVAKMTVLKAKLAAHVGKGTIDDPAIAKECQVINVVLAEAVEMEPGRGDIAAFELLLRGIKMSIRIAQGELPDLQPLLAEGRALVKRFPNLADAHYALAYLEVTWMQVEVKRKTWPGVPKAVGDVIIAEMTRVLRLDPTYGDVYLMRGLMYAATGEVEKARVDWQRAEQLKHSFALPEALQQEINPKP